MATNRYTDEELARVVAESFSTMEVLRKLGIRMAGGNHHHMKSKIEKLNIDTSHFKRQGHNRGLPARNRLAASDVFVYDRLDGRREKATVLRRALIEYGVRQECQCGVGTEWNGKPIQLEVDHINGDFVDNRIENLRFICPNCHSQEDSTNMPHKYRNMPA